MRSRVKLWERCHREGRIAEVAIRCDRHGALGAHHARRGTARPSRRASRRDVGALSIVDGKRCVNTRHPAVRTGDGSARRCRCGGAGGAPDVQAELAVLAAQHGCHLLLDKPIALDEAAAEVLTQAVTGAGVSATVFFTLLYEPSVARWVQQNASEAWFAARIRMFSATFDPGSPYAGSDWRRKYGALWDVGPHALAVALRVLGPMHSIAALHGAGTSTDVIVGHERGATSSLSLSLTSPVAVCGSDWTFYGDRGAMTVPVPDFTTSQAFTSCVTDLVRAIRTGDEPWCGVRFGLEIVRALSAAEAAASGPTSAAHRNGRA